MKLTGCKVKIASSHEIPFLVTGGGHGVSVQLANLKEGIQVDLGKFNNVTFDSDTQLLTVGGAAKFSQLIDPLYELGYQFRKLSFGSVLNFQY